MGARFSVDLTERRTIELDRASIRADGRELDLSFSSEAPVRRVLHINGRLLEGDEVLSHRAEHVDLGWLGSGRAPLLVEHDRGRQIGAVLSARVDGAKTRGRVRFSSSPEAQGILQDIRDGIRGNVSIGYSISEVEIEERDDGFPIIRATQWRPIEASLVSIPADETVGAGRSPADGVPMTTEKTKPVEGGTNAADEARIAGIRTYARHLGLDESFTRHHIAAGSTVEEARTAALKLLPKQEPLGVASDMGFLDQKERRQYSLRSALAYLMAPPSEKRAAERDAGFELEVGEEAARRSGGKGPRGLIVPREIFGERLLSVGTPTAGGNVVGTDHLGSEFVQDLKNQPIVQRLGARVLSGLVGDVVIPRRTAGSSVAWIATEDAEAAESDPAFDQISMSPKDLASFTSFSRRLMLQSDPSIEALVRDDLAGAIAVGIDAAAIAGTGASGQPQGIIGTTGVGTQSLATLSFAALAGMKADVLAANSAQSGNLGFALNATGWQRMATTSKDAGSGQFLLDDAMRALGHRVEVSENVPSDLGGGSDLSAVIFGNWSDLMIGLWGGLDLVVDPYTDSRRGRTRVTVFQTIDVAVRHPESFSVATDLAAS